MFIHTRYTSNGDLRNNTNVIMGFGIVFFKDSGCADWARTSESWSQSPLPYHLATAHYKYYIYVCISIKYYKIKLYMTYFNLVRHI